MVITGGSTGIGYAVAKAFENEFSVVTVSRSKGDFVGDLTDKSFRNKILSETNPHVFLNCAGVFPKDETAVTSFQINFVALMDLTVGMLKKMTDGFIFNISSVSATVSPSPFLCDIAYSTAKKAVSDFTHVMQYGNRSPVKICTIEPGFVMTDMANIQKRYKGRDPKDFIVRNGIIPMDPQYLSQVMRWIMQQPPEVVISQIRIMNKLFK